MRGHHVWTVGVAVVAAAVLAGRSAHGQSCYQGAGPSMVNICPTAKEDIDYRTYGTYGIAAVTVSGTSYAFDIHGNSLDIYDVTNPASPARRTSSPVSIPWWPPPDGGSDPSLINRFRGLATLNGFPYALASFYTDGWDFFKLGTNTFLRVGYSPDNRTSYLSSALFRSGSEVYAVGQGLDATAIAQYDPSVYLYLVWNGTTITPESINYTTMAGHRYRVPIGGGSGDGAYGNFMPGPTSAYHPFVVNGQPWLLVANSIKQQAVAVDMYNPFGGTPLPTPRGAIWTSTAYPNLFSGPWAVDRDHAMLHVASRDGATVYSYDISNPTNGPALIATTPWHDATISPSCALPAISAGGGVIAVGCGNYVGYVPTDAKGLPSPPALPADSGPTQATYINPLQCNPAMSLGPFVRGLSVFVTPSQQTSVARAIYSWGDVIALSDSCLSTVPVPAFTVAGGSTAATCTAAPTQPSTGVAEEGFPGDTFTITDTSRGTIASGTLVLNPGAIKSWSEAASHAWTPQPLQWPSPSTQDPGEYQLTMTLHDQTTGYQLTQSIVLCGTPAAKAQVTAVDQLSMGNFVPCATCTYLNGDTVTVSADNTQHTLTEGHPTAYGWMVTQPNGSAAPNFPQVNLSLGSINVPLTLPNVGQNDYIVTVAAQYGFGSGTSNCAGVNPAILGQHYTSCSTIHVLSLPFSVSQITVSQGSTSATSTSPRTTFLRGQPLKFSATYRVGPGYTPTFLWGLNGSSAAPAPNPADTTTTPGTVQGVIPASTLAAATGYTASFVQATAQAGAATVDLTGTITPVTFDVLDCQPAVRPTGLSASVSGEAPSATVTITWSSGGTSPVTYRVHDTLGLMTFCTGIVDQKSCTYTATSAGTFQFKVDATNACSGGTLTSTQTGSFTVTASTPPPPPPTESANFTFSPTNPEVGQQISFYGTASGGTPTRWSWTFGDGLGPIGGGGSSNLQNPTYSYSSAATFTVTLTVSFSSGSQKSVSKAVTVSAPCTATGAPTASFTYASPARATIAVQFTDTSAGGPTSWSWDFGDGIPPILGAHTSTAQNPTNVFANPGTYTVKLTATNCKGSNTTPQQVQVVGSCDLTVPPTADFTWGPTGPLPDFPSQPQPFVGQPVTLTDNSTNSPNSWHWYDFQEDVVNATVATPTFTHTWSQPGDKNVRMAATNCFGASADVFKVVHIFDDVRPVAADFTWSPTTNVTTNTQVTFTASQGMSYGSPTSFTWKFDDGSTQTGRSVTYSFKCGGDRTVTLTAVRGSYTGTANKTVSVAGQTCGPESVMAVDAAKVQGLNGTSWRTDVRILNPAGHTSAVHLQFLPVGKNNVTPFMAGPYPIGPKATLVLNNLLDWVFITLGQNFSKTALRVTYDNQDDLAPAVMARTYTPGPSGGNYGQFAPGIAVIPGTTPSTIWITGLHNDGFSSGFRTNYSLLNLRDDSGGSGTIRFTLFDATGAERGTATVGLAPFGYLQDSVSKLLGGNFDTIGDFSLKIDVPPGADIQAYGSVVDNLTGDPSLIPAVTPADSPIYLPAIAHLVGEAGTVWRSDLAVTNPDLSSAHTWELQYTPKQSGGPQVAKRTVTLAPGASYFVDDLVSWAYSGLLPADAQTSGIVRVGMGEGDSSGVYPVIAARSYNLTPNGTFGQNIMPMWAANGVSIDSNNKTMLIAGMSSEDIARTNLAFVSLSDTQGVNFSVLFYDESGNLLNPSDGQGNPTPFNFYVPPGSWDQDKLENRFLRAFKVSLPPNERAVSAVMTVVGGGPGLAYATVIDNQTGDPNFIPAQPTP